MARKKRSGDNEAARVKGVCEHHGRELTACEDCIRNIEANMQWRTLEQVRNSFFEAILKPVGKMEGKELWQNDPLDSPALIEDRQKRERWAKAIGFNGVNGRVLEDILTFFEHNDKKAFDQLLNDYYNVRRGD